MSLIIGADIVPTTNNSLHFKNGEVETLVGDKLVDILNAADYRIFNLETPLTDIHAPIKKCGPALRADSATVLALKKMNVNLFTLANNHIMDQGRQGLVSTLQVLDDNRIEHLGAGMNIEQAQKSVVVNIKGRKIGVYACAEHEFSIASEKKAGANPFDPLESFDHVKQLKNESEFVIVLYHGGKEHYQFPSPMLQRVCRKFIEKGADLVICQHSHCIGCEEKYHNATIVYGQGNFLFDSCSGPYVQSSLVVELKDDLTVDYIPLVKCNGGVRLAVGEVAEGIMKDFAQRGTLIKQPAFIEEEYKKFAQKMLKGYLLMCSGYFHRRLLRLVDKLTMHKLHFFKEFGYTTSEKNALRNYIECEAHRELWIEGLKVFNG